MSKSKEQLIDEELGQRLQKIAFHFKQREELRVELETCTPSTNSVNPMADEKIAKLVTKINNEEIGMLYELVHLKDNVEKYLKVFKQSPGDLDVIDKFKPFRVASNYVNTHKHGSRGGNRPSAKHEYTITLYAKSAKEASPSDRMDDVRAMINFEGELFDSIVLAEALIRIWELFLRYHTTHDLSKFLEKINQVLRSPKRRWQYSESIPQGVLKDAKVKADERKQFKI